MRLRALLGDGSPGLRLLGGDTELDRVVRGVVTTDLRDPSRYLSGGELVLTGLSWRRGPEDSEPFVRHLVTAGVTALAAGEAESGPVPEDLVVACARHRLPLFAVAEEVAFAGITEYVARQVSGERASDLVALVDRHRRLVSPDPAGGGPRALLDLLRADLDLRAWVLSPTGREIAGPGSPGPHRTAGPTAGPAAGSTAGPAAGPTAGPTAGPAAGSTAGHRAGPAGDEAAGTLPRSVRGRLAAHCWEALRAGRRGSRVVTVSGTPYSLLPIPDGVPTSLRGTTDVPPPPSADPPPADPPPAEPPPGEATHPDAAVVPVPRTARHGTPEPPPGESSSPEPPAAKGAPPAGWFLAVEGDAGEWPHRRRELLNGVALLIAAERDHREEAHTVRHRLAREVLRALVDGASSAEIATHLRLARSMTPEDHPAAGRWQLLVARIDGRPHRLPAHEPTAHVLLAELLAGAVAPLDPAPLDPTPATPMPATPAPKGTPGAPDPADGAVPDELPAPATGLPGTVLHHTVAPDGEEALALVSLAPPAVPGGPGPVLTAAGLLTAPGPALVDALGRQGRLSVGVSAAVDSAAGLLGAWEEARHARVVAGARPGRLNAAGHEDLASHVLLLPFVPEEVRRAFATRLLDPLRDYDRRHRAALVPTLAAFLDCDGSWTRSATRLHLHVNTLRYRIGRIERLTGRDLSRLTDRVDFLLALRMG